MECHAYRWNVTHIGPKQSDLSTAQVVTQGEPLGSYREEFRRQVQPHELGETEFDQSQQMPARTTTQIQQWLFLWGRDQFNDGPDV